MSFCYLFLFAILVSLTKAVPLDGNCTQNAPCDNTSGLICPNTKCQCDAPWYQPCTTSCVLKPSSFYEGDECRHDDNCITPNARCNNATTRRCVCRDGFSAFNGLCYKKNNETCLGNNDCLSQNCVGSRCACKDNYELLADGRCRRKLARLYPDWFQANATRDFCSDDLSCSNILAQCKSDTTHPEKFCQCPSTAYKTNTDKQECERIEIERLSPVNGPPVADNRTCGFCKVDNAVCAAAGTQTTCWCRAGYDKVGENCAQIRSKFIFPSAADQGLHLYGANCANNSNATTSDGLCVCAPGYQFDIGNRNCKKIEAKWISEYFQYGICTRIRSDGFTAVQNPQLLCADGLSCASAGDKNICSCGQDQFLEQYSNGTTPRCVYRLGKNAAGNCPSNAAVVNGTCQCNDGFKQVDEDRGCELLLQPNNGVSSCTVNGPTNANDSCSRLFGVGAIFCQTGVCRCNPNFAFNKEDNTGCYGFLNITQTTNIACPPNSRNDPDTTCQCKPGFIIAENGRRCAPKSPLFEWGQGVINPDLEPQDCTTIYSGSVAAYNASYLTCQCDASSFVSPDRLQCWNKVYTNIINSAALSCSMPNSFLNQTSNQCNCDPGYRPSDGNRKNCERINANLEGIISSTEPIADPIDDFDCRSLFGVLSVLNGSQCTCRENTFHIQNIPRCYALLNIPNILPTLGDDSCPTNAYVDTPGMCQCKPGFLTDPSNRSCRMAEITLVGAKTRVSPFSCANYTDDPCMVKYGDASFCDNNQCWCDRQLSFIASAGRCEYYSKYIFPAQHERNNVSCDTATDCISDTVTIDKVECTQIFSTNDYKVCVCKAGYYLNPETQTCETRCPSNCAGLLNTVCNGYNCTCTAGFIPDVNGSCIANPNVLELYKPCDNSFAARNNDPFTCSSCGRGACIVGYKDTGFQCVKYNFDSDRCVAGNNFCNSLIGNSQCSTDDNKCICLPGYYRNGNNCSRLIGLSCQEDEQCGNNARCDRQRCQCNAGVRVGDGQDAYGRTIKVCLNGIDQLRFSPILLLFIVFARIFFA